MSRIAFLFPGQGSHEVGMGADLLRSDPWVRDHVQTVSSFVGEDVERICLKGPERKLMQSAIVQPLLTIMSMGYARKLAACGIVADIVAGHSLGEISALAQSGALTDELAVQVAMRRGMLMDEAAAQTPGGMVAVFRPLAWVEALLQKLALQDQVFVANDNADKQVVVSATRDLLADFVQLANAEEAGCCKPLRVSGPWHTPWLAGACAVFTDWLETVPFQSPRIAFVANATGCVETDPARLRYFAAHQLTGRVNWRFSMETLRQHDVDTIFEVGPGRVLAGLARLNGFGNETVVRNVDSIRAVTSVCNDYSAGGGK